MNSKHPNQKNISIYLQFHFYTYNKTVFLQPNYEKQKTMKKIFYSILALATITFTTSCGNSETSENNGKHQDHATEKNPDAVDGKLIDDAYYFYGLEEFTPQEGISVDSMLSVVSANGSFTGVIEAEIVEVCQKAGCWSKLKSANEPVMVFYKEHFGIPTNTEAGTKVTLNGIAQIDTLSVDFQKHLLDDAKSNGEEVSQAEYDAITEDKIEVSFEASGVLIPVANSDTKEEVGTEEEMKVEIAE